MTFLDWERENKRKRALQHGIDIVKPQIFDPSRAHGTGPKRRILSKRMKEARRAMAALHQLDAKKRVKARRSLIVRIGELRRADLRDAISSSRDVMRQVQRPYDAILDELLGARPGLKARVGRDRSGTKVVSRTISAPPSPQVPTGGVFVRRARTIVEPRSACEAPPPGDFGFSGQLDARKKPLRLNDIAKALRRRGTELKPRVLIAELRRAGIRLRTHTSLIPFEIARAFVQSRRKTAP